MKLTVSIKGSSQLKETVKKTIEKAVDDAFLKEIGAEVVKDIQINTRRGYGITNGQSVPLAPLAPYTIEQRQAHEKAGNARAFPFQPEISNLSVSGQLIDSVGFEIVDGVLEIGAGVGEGREQRTPYKRIEGFKATDRIQTNSELADFHHKGDALANRPRREFIGLRDKMKVRILIKLREKLRRGLEVVFKVRK